MSKENVIVTVGIRAKLVPRNVSVNMSMTKQFNKSHANRPVDIEEQMLYLQEVLDNLRYEDEHVKELVVLMEDWIDIVAICLDGMPIQELMFRVDTLEEIATRVGGFERGDSLTGSVAQIKERVNGLDSSQKVVVHGQLPESGRSDAQRTL